MEPIDIIELKPMDLYNQKMHEGTELRIELYDKYFRYIGNFHAEEPINRDDHSLGFQTIYNNFNIVADKKCIVAIDKNWSDRYKHYCLYISINGMAEDVKLFFKKEKEIDAVMEKLIQYLYE